MASKRVKGMWKGASGVNWEGGAANRMVMRASFRTSPAAYPAHLLLLHARAILREVLLERFHLERRGDGVMTALRHFGHVTPQAQDVRIVCPDAIVLVLHAEDPNVDLPVGVRHCGRATPLGVANALRSGVAKVHVAATLATGLLADTLQLLVKRVAVDEVDVTQLAHDGLVVGVGER